MKKDHRNEPRFILFRDKMRVCRNWDEGPCIKTIPSVVLVQSMVLSASTLERGTHAKHSIQRARERVLSLAIYAIPSKRAY